MSWLAEPTDEQAMWRVQQHEDLTAFGVLMTRWEKPIQRLCLRMLDDEHRAADLVQEAFARVFFRRNDFIPSARFSSWLWRIALNLCHDELRRRVRRSETSLETVSDFEGMTPDSLVAPEPGPGDAMVAAERAAGVRAALQRVPELYRSVLILRHYENLKFADIGEILEIPEGTVKSRMSEGLNRLETLLRRAETGAVSADQSPIVSNRAQRHPNPAGTPNETPSSFLKPQPQFP